MGNTPDRHPGVLDDWRMPNVNEIDSLFDFRYGNAAQVGIDTEFFPSMGEEQYLSSTPDPEDSNSVYVVNFGYGERTRTTTNGTEDVHPTMVVRSRYLV
jgi:hypothetical protein